MSDKIKVPFPTKEEIAKRRAAYEVRMDEHCRRHENQQLKREKHEKIEKMAFEIYKTANEILIEKNDQPAIYRDIPLWEQAWNLAERFYKFAKKKEEVNDGIC